MKAMARVNRVPPVPRVPYRPARDGRCIEDRRWQWPDPVIGIGPNLNVLRRWCYPNQDSLVTAAIGSAAVPNGRKPRDAVGGDSDFRIRSERWH